jgi:putative spermidine/putrescine transport system substrate-binding protein
MTIKQEKKGVSRRTVLKGAAATAGAAIGSGAVTGFPTIWAQNIKDVTLRQFGTGVSNLNEVAQKVKEDLGFTLEMTALDSDAVTQRAATQPDSFDIADIEYWICKKVWPTGNLQAMDTSRIKNYDKIVGIFRNGKLTPESEIAQGTAPHTVGFTRRPGGKDFVAGRIRLDDADPDDLQRRHAGHPPRPDRPPDQQLVRAAEPRIQGQGLDPRHLVDRHHGHGDGCESMGEIKYGDKGNMTREEIDKTIGDLHRGQEERPVPRLLEDLRRERQPDGVGRGGDPVDVVARDHRREVARAFPASTSRWKEGYRSWGGGIGLSKSLTGLELDAAYEYINWYLDGWVGGFLMRQGYYSAVPETSKNFMSEDEWGYWFEGKEATGDITNPFGDKSWPRPAKPATAARSTTAWARSPAGTR